MVFKKWGCKFSRVDKKETPRVKDFEKYLKQCNILENKDTKCSATAAVVFNYSLGEMERVIAMNLQENMVILVISVDMYVNRDDQNTIEAI